MSHSEKPSTDSVSWLWNESRRISPSVRTASPAASCRRTASSTAASSMRLNAACEISFRASRSRASMSSGGRSRLPTTSDCASITPPLYGGARLGMMDRGFAVLRATGGHDA